MSQSCDCFQNDLNSFTEIHDEVHSFVISNDDINKVFAVKCGDERKDCMFVCEKYLGIVILQREIIVALKNHVLIIQLCFILTLIKHQLVKLIAQVVLNIIYV